MPVQPAAIVLVLSTCLFLACGSEPTRPRTDMQPDDAEAERDILEPRADSTYNPGDEHCSIGFIDKLGPPCGILSDVDAGGAAMPLCREAGALATIDCTLGPLDPQQRRELLLQVRLKPVARPPVPFRIDFDGGVTQVVDCGAEGQSELLQHSCLLSLSPGAEASLLQASMQVALEADRLPTALPAPDAAARLPRARPRVHPRSGGGAVGDVFSVHLVRNELPPRQPGGSMITSAYKSLTHPERWWSQTGAAAAAPAAEPTAAAPVEMATDWVDARPEAAETAESGARPAARRQPGRQRSGWFTWRRPGKHARGTEQAGATTATATGAAAPAAARPEAGLATILPEEKQAQPQPGLAKSEAPRAEVALARVLPELAPGAPTLTPPPARPPHAGGDASDLGRAWSLASGDAGSTAGSGPERPSWRGRLEQLTGLSGRARGWLVRLPSRPLTRRLGPVLGIAVGLAMVVGLSRVARSRSRGRLALGRAQAMGNPEAAVSWRCGPARAQPLAFNSRPVSFVVDP